MSESDGFTFNLTDEEMGLAKRPAYGKFSNPRLNANLVDAIVLAMSKGAQSAYYALAINYGFEFSMRGLKLPSVRERLPCEVTLRSLVAERIGYFAAAEGVERGLFVKAYEQNEKLREFLDDEARERLSDEVYLGSFASAPWAEASQTIGGAYGALADHGVIDGRPDIIANSRGLQVIALLPAEARKKHVKGYLGGTYAAHDRFDVLHHGAVTTIVFNQDTLEFIGKFMIDGRGCSAADIRSHDGLEGTSLQRSFTQMTQLLLRDEAVATVGFHI
jgi:hypothetical protein